MAAVALAQRPRNFRDADWQASVQDGDIERVIEKGGEKLGLSPLMPGWQGILSQAQIKALVVKIRAFQSPKPREPITLKKPSHPKLIYNEFCLPCHGVNGQGDGPSAKQLAQSIGLPNFTDANWQKQRTDAQLRQTIRQGGAAVGLSNCMPG